MSPNLLPLTSCLFHNEQKMTASKHERVNNDDKKYPLISRSTVTVLMRTQEEMEEEDKSNGIS